MGKTTDTPVTVRAATPADAAFITECNRALAAETEAKSLELQRLRAGVEAFLCDSHKGSYFIAETDGRAVGQLAMTFEWSDWRNGNFWWIQSVYVIGEFRARGVFSALFEHVRELARSQRDCCGLRLYVENLNARAKQAYLRKGMKNAGYEVFELDFTAPGSDGAAAPAQETNRRPAGEGLVYRVGNDLDVAAVIELYRASTLGERRPVDDRDRMAAMLRQANLVVTAWDENVLVGIARSVSDFSYCTYLSDLAVRVSHQRRGVGRELMRRTQQLGGQAAIILLAAPKAEEYYPRIGLTPHPQAWILNATESLR